MGRKLVNYCWFDGRISRCLAHFNGDLPLIYFMGSFLWCDNTDLVPPLVTEENGALVMNVTLNLMKALCDKSQQNISFDKKTQRDEMTHLSNEAQQMIKLLRVEAGCCRCHDPVDVVNHVRTGLVCHVPNAWQLLLLQLGTHELHQLFHAVCVLHLVYVTCMRRKKGERSSHDYKSNSSKQKHHKMPSQRHVNPINTTTSLTHYKATPPYLQEDITGQHDPHNHITSTINMPHSFRHPKM